MIFNRMVATPHQGVNIALSPESFSGSRSGRLSIGSVTSVESDDSLTSALIRGAQNVSQPKTPRKWEGDSLTRLSSQLAEAFAGIKLKPANDLEMASLRRDKAAKEREVKNLSGRLAEQKNTLEESQLQIANLVARESGLKIEMSAQVAINLKSQKELVRVEKTKAKLQGALRDLTGSATATKLELDRLKSANGGSASTELKGLIDDRVSEQKSKSLESAVDDLRGELASVKEELEQVTSDKTFLSEARSEEGVSHLTEVSELRERAFGLDTENKDLQTRLKKAETTAGGLREQLKAATIQRDELVSLFNSLSISPELLRELLQHVNPTVANMLSDHAEAIEPMTAGGSADSRDTRGRFLTPVKTGLSSLPEHDGEDSDSVPSAKDRLSTGAVQSEGGTAVIAPVIKDGADGEDASGKGHSLTIAKQGAKSSKLKKGTNVNFGGAVGGAEKK